MCTRLVRLRARTVPCMADDDIAREIRRQAKEQIPERATVEISDGLTEDEAVASAIEQYKALTGIELPEADVRAEVREKMAGRDTT